MSDTQELSDIGVPCPSAPGRIWLQVDPEPFEEGTAVYACDDTTWCADKINSNDTLYIRADIALLARASVPTEAQTSELEDMRARKDAAYEERNRVVAALAKVFPSGVARTAIEGWSEDWHGCVYIDLPTGQASWHFHDSQAHLFAGLPPYTKLWDGHSTEEKYRRVAALAASPPQSAPDGGDARDAKRYRWLRERLAVEDVEQLDRDFWGTPDEAESKKTDAAIDAAISAVPAGKE